MILPKDDQCRRVLDALADDSALTQWEWDFIDSNRGRQTFTDAQREVIGRMMEKYDVS